MRIFIIGFMGSGKTTVGKSLAHKLHLSFTDLDSYIEEMSGQGINDFFSEKGENIFRKIERKALKEILKKDNLVLSCGGGTPCFYDNIEMMNKKGVTVYLKYPIGKLKSRLLPNNGKRPLLNEFTPEDLESFIKTTLQEREKFYLKSKLVIQNPAKMSEIVTAVSDYLKGL